jgi:hypothetical protein
MILYPCYGDVMRENGPPMRFAWRSKRPVAATASDYGRLNDVVKARREERQERSRGAEQWPTVDQVRQGTRAYAPEERLRNLPGEVERFQRDAGDLPRVWESEDYRGRLLSPWWKGTVWEVFHWLAMGALALTGVFLIAAWIMGWLP